MKKIEETVEFWKNYINTHPEKEIASKSSFTLNAAPYGDIWVRELLGQKGIAFYVKGETIDYWHRLDGPAYIGNEAGNGAVYFIKDKEVRVDEFEKHPLVVEYRMHKLIKEVLEEQE